MPGVDWHELVYGLEGMPASRRKDDLFSYLTISVYATLPILPYDEGATVWHGSERARLNP